MKKFAVRICSCIIVFAMALAGTVTAFAASLEDYQAVNEDQKDYYNEVYKPVYRQYLNTIEEFRSEISRFDFASADDAEDAIDFLASLVSEHHAFYGDRVTEGTSRYDVPAAREAMYAAADDEEDYDTAIDLCHTLKALVRERVDYMNDVMDAIDDYTLIPVDIDDDDDDDDVDENPILDYARALEASVSSLGSKNTEYIHSGAQDAPASYAAALGAIMTENGYDPTEYMWTIRFVSRAGMDIIYIIVSDGTANSTDDILVAYQYADGTLTEGTATVGKTSYTNPDETKTHYYILDRFSED